MWEVIGKDNGLTWVYTNTHTWELIGNDGGLTWVNTNTPTWVLIGTATWVNTNTLTRELNRYRRTRPDRTGWTAHFKSFHRNKPIGASPGRDYVVQTGMVLQIIQYDTLLHSVQNNTSKKGGRLRGLRIKK
jgi:hypothetical protein